MKIKSGIDPDQHPFLRGSSTRSGEFPLPTLSRPRASTEPPVIVATLGGTYPQDETAAALLNTKLSPLKNSSHRSFVMRTDLFPKNSFRKHLRKRKHAPFAYFFVSNIGEIEMICSVTFVR
jgi:hypothetical protein